MKYVYYRKPGTSSGYSIFNAGGLSGEKLRAEDYGFIAKTDADDVFRVMNSVMGDPETELSTKLGIRSISVGDLYVENGEAWVCAPTGWLKAPEDFVDLLNVANVMET